MNTEQNLGIKLVLGAVAIFIILFVVSLLLPFTIIGAGERGVVMKLGKVQPYILNEGFHVRTPFQDEIRTINVKTKTTGIDGVAGSSDSQAVTFKAAVNWRMNPNRVNVTYQKVGDENDVETNLIKNKGPDSIKAAISRSTAIDFQKNREDVRKAAISLLRERVGDVAIIDDISFTDIDFSKQFNDAIEEKVTAEQNAIAEKNKLEGVKYQAQQKIESAKAEAESIRIQTEALSQNDKLIDLRAVERWNGVLPVNMYGSAPLPFLNVNR